MFKRNKQGKLVKDHFSQVKCFIKNLFKKDVNKITEFLLKSGNKYGNNNN